MTSSLSTVHWAPIDPNAARRLTDARLQLHYAAQYATALGISFLPPEADDSHTNLGWDQTREALVSRRATVGTHEVAVAVRPRDLTLLVVRDDALDQPVPLHGLTVVQAEGVLRNVLSAAGLEAARFTLRRHFELPSHPVRDGAAFDGSAREPLEQLARWYANASLLLADFRSRHGSSEVRCWPHHFDIATLVNLGRGRSSGAGLSPGDETFDEPYLYVNAYPAPADPPATGSLAGGGFWNTTGWVGAVLPGSRFVQDAVGQARQSQAFLDSAFEACRRLTPGD
jgi:hypothetical protein